MTHEKPEKSRLVSRLNLFVTWAGLLVKEVILSGRLLLCSALLWLLYAVSPLPKIFGEIPTFILSYGLIFACIYGAAQLIRTISLPRKEDILRQIELSNNLAHRPLRSLQDHYPSNQAIHLHSKKIWQYHQRHLQQSLPKLKVGLPKPFLARLDPYAIRFLALFLFIIFTTIHPPQLSNLTAQMLKLPSFGPPQLPIMVDAWVTP
ncbi:MAG: DUF4175 family protein, partial [Alphaproteobacteria bacterium]|nr:DUF4175 family protein [Alphaproteobacteria bacterium]